MKNINLNEMIKIQLSRSEFNPWLPRGSLKPITAQTIIFLKFFYRVSFIFLNFAIHKSQFCFLQLNPKDSETLCLWENKFLGDFRQKQHLYITAIIHYTGTDPKLAGGGMSEKKLEPHPTLREEFQEGVSHPHREGSRKGSPVPENFCIFQCKILHFEPQIIYIFYISYSLWWPE